MLNNFYFDIQPKFNNSISNLKLVILLNPGLIHATREYKSSAVFSASADFRRSSPARVSPFVPWKEDLSITLLASQSSVCIYWPCALLLAGTIFAIPTASTETTPPWGSLLGSQWWGCLNACFLPLVFIVNVLSQLLSQVSRLLRAGLGTKPPFISMFLWERSFQGPDIQMKRVFFFWKIHSPPVKLGSVTL